MILFFLTLPVYVLWALRFLLVALAIIVAIVVAAVLFLLVALFAGLCVLGIKLVTRRR